MSDRPTSGFYWNCLRPHKKYADFSLSPWSQKVLMSANAGGSSIISESLSAEVLVRMFGAGGIRTEMEIEYVTSSKIVDFTIKMYGKNVGVSVTRAMGWPIEAQFTYAHGHRLMRKKIAGLIVARENARERFDVAILHVMCSSNRIKNVLYRVYKKLPRDFTCDIIVLCTVADESRYIFTNKVET